MSSNGIVLSSAVRTNLLALQNTAEMQGKVQERLATGKKVNSALDNATNFYTAGSLNRRAQDLSSLLDGMSNGIKTLQAADNAMTSITKVAESMQANLRQARQDKSFKGQSLSIDAGTIGTGGVKTISFSGGSVGASAVSVKLNAVRSVTGSGGFQGSGGTVGSASTFTIQNANLNGGTAVSVAATASDTVDTLVAKVNSALNGATGGNAGLTAEVSGGQIKLTSSNNTDFTIGGTVTGTGLTATTTNTETAGAAKSVDQLVSLINASSSLTDKVKASNDGGKLRIDNLSTGSLTVTGVGTNGVDGGSGNTTVGGNEVRKNLMAQFNDLRTQLDKLAGDASFNGINLLKGDLLKLNFNEVGTSSIQIQAKDSAGNPHSVNTDPNSLNITAANAAEYSSDQALDGRIDGIGTALTALQTQASSFGSTLSTVQIRQDFTKAMINTLQTGADNLTLADQNEEGANLLSLNTRQQLSQTALSLSTQAQQAVLRLFG